MQVLPVSWNDPVRLWDFAAFPNRHYRGHPGYVPMPPEELISEWDPGRNPFFRHGEMQAFLAVEGGLVLGRVAAFRNPKLDAGEKRVGTVGLFETLVRNDVAEALLSAAFAWLRLHEVNWVLGPMNGSVWSSYRFRTDGFDESPHLFQPYNMRFYPALFEDLGFSPLRYWISREIDFEDAETNRILEERMPKFEKRYREALEKGFVEETNRPETWERDFREIHDVGSRAFSSHLEYASIDYEEFSFLFGGLRDIIRPGQMTLFRKEGRLYAFSISVSDLAQALVAMNGRRHLLAKLKALPHLRPRTEITLFVGMEPEAMKNHSGLASAGFYASLRAMRENRGVRKLIHPLMYEGNRSLMYSEGIGRQIGRFVLMGRSI